MCSFKGGVPCTPRFSRLLDPSMRFEARGSRSPKKKQSKVCCVRPKTARPGGAFSVATKLREVGIEVSVGRGH